MAIYHLHKWSVIDSGNPYTAPEALIKYLRGFRDQENKAVTTSAIVSVNGREVTTYSGSIYILEDIDPEYLEWLDSNGRTYDPNNPIKFK